MSPNPSPPSAAGKWLRRGILTVVLIPTGVALAWVVENWRGERAWKAYQAELAAAGLPSAWSFLVPAPVPEGKNLAESPLLRPVVAHHRDPQSGSLIWDDRPGQTRFRILSHRPPFFRGAVPQEGNWTRGQRWDLAAWQKFYRDAAPGSAASAPPPATGLDPVLAQRYGLTTPPAPAPASGSESPSVSASASASESRPAANQPKPRLEDGAIPLPADLAARLGVETILSEEDFRHAVHFPVPATPGVPATDVLLGLGRIEPELETLAREAAQRPESRWGVHWEERPQWGILLPHLAATRKLVTLLSFRASARLANGQADAALADLRLAFRIAETHQAEPLTISQLVRAAEWKRALQPVWEGILDHRWTDAQLTVLAEDLQAVNLPAAVPACFQSQMVEEMAPISKAERQELAAFLPDAVGLFSEPISPAQQFWSRQFILYAPLGWFHQCEVRSGRAAWGELTNFLATVGTPAAVQHLVPPPSKPLRLTPYSFLLKPGAQGQGFRKLVAETAEAQTRLQLALAAIALERHRITFEKLPARLEELVPMYLDRVPTDALTGVPLHYRLGGPGGYQLYAFGPDGRDDRGRLTPEVADRGDGPGAAPAAGDWVWPSTELKE